MAQTFKAGTHYGDWEGTAAADGPHSDSVQDYLEKNGLISDEEFLIATSIYLIEGTPYIRAYTFTGGPAMESVQDAIAKHSGPIPVREIRLEITLGEFIKMFKQIHVILTWHGLNLQGVTFNPVED